MIGVRKMTPLVAMGRPSNEQLGAALACAVEALGDGTIDAVTRARWVAGDVPHFETLAAQLCVSIDDLVEVFRRELYEATGQIIVKTGHVQ